MKKFMIALTALFTLCITANAMSYEQAREQALFLTDKMAYELNLTDDQYEAAYEINLDYLMSIESYNDLYGIYWNRRNMDLSYILLDWQYRAYCAANYFYRPLYWDAGYWHFGVYARYPHRSYFYFGRPVFFTTYRGGHSWHMNGGRSWYNGRSWGMEHRRVEGGRGIGMRNRFDRGDYRNAPGNAPRGNNRNMPGGNGRSAQPQRNTPSTSHGTAQPNGNRTGGNQGNATFGGNRANANPGNGSFNGSRGANPPATSGNRGNGVRPSSTRTTVGNATNRPSGTVGSSRSDLNRGSGSNTPSRTFTPSRPSGSSSTPSHVSTPSSSRFSSPSSSSAPSRSSVAPTRSSGSSSSSHGNFGGSRSRR